MKRWNDIVDNISLEGGKNSILWKPELLDDLVDVERKLAVAKP